MGVLLGYAILFNILVLLAQTYLGRKFSTLCQTCTKCLPPIHRCWSLAKHSELIMNGLREL